MLTEENQIRAKIARFKSGSPLRTLDLFAGCGGLSLGFHRAGFHSIGAIELNQHARQSHEINFAPLAAKQGLEYRSFEDVTKTTPSDATKHLGDLITSDTSNVDVIIGGPPCQAYSRLGRAALWRLAGKDQAHGEDARASMYNYYLEYVRSLQPIAFVMENVREIGKHVGRNIAEEIALQAEEYGYQTRYTLLNAAWFGVPQYRERVFIVGIHKSLGVLPEFPDLEFKTKLPVGYSTSRSGDGHDQMLSPRDHFVDHFNQKKRQKSAITVSEAFADLPPITDHFDGSKPIRVRQDLSIESRYTKNYTANWFTKEMRTWPGFQSSKQTFLGHIIRNTPRDYPIFRDMPHGGMYPEALEVAESLFEKRIKLEEEKSGIKIKPNSNIWKQLRADIVPPYKAGRYPNKFRKMSPDEPCRTVPAHIGKDVYSHIHFDSKQARGVSVREVARLMSFPDAFQLSGSMNHVLTQLGNAVPPLLAYAVARQLKKSLQNAKI